MRFFPKDPPRRFPVGNSAKFEIKDCGSVELGADEQITFVTAGGAEYDVARKEWGFYATPSLDARLEGFGLRAVLIRNTMTGRYFVLLVERSKEPAFEQYCEVESLEVVAWLDRRQALDQLRDRMRSGA